MIEKLKINLVKLLYNSGVDTSVKNREHLIDPV